MEIKLGLKAENPTTFTTSTVLSIRGGGKRWGSLNKRKKGFFTCLPLHSLISQIGTGGYLHVRLFALCWE